MNEEMAELAAELAELTQEIKGLRVDVCGLERKQADLQQEFRDEIKALRGDLALTTSRQNSAIQDNKKKLPGSLAVSPVSTGD